LEISAKIVQSFFSSSVMNGYQNMLVQVKNVIVISVFYFMDREFAIQLLKAGFNDPPNFFADGHPQAGMFSRSKVKLRVCRAVGFDIARGINIEPNALTS